MTSEDEQLASLCLAESALLQHAAKLDAPVARTVYHIALVSLGQRSRSLFRAFLELQDGQVPLAARSLLRPMVEINILVRFLCKDPGLHTELWLAEYERSVLTLVDDFKRYPHLRDRWGELPVNHAQLDECRRIVEAARRKALDAGMPGIGGGGPVLPSTTHQLTIIKEPGADEAYVLAYRSLSPDIHGGARAVAQGTFEERDGGRVAYRDDAGSKDDLLPARALALTTFASTLVIVSGQLGLGIEEEANEIKSRFVRS